MTFVYWKGKIRPSGKVSISPVNTGLFFGENIFEAVPVYRGKPLFLTEHLKRLNRGCAFLKWPYLRENEVKWAIRAFSKEEGQESNFMIRFNLVQELRGQVNLRNFSHFQPTMFATIRPLRHNPEALSPTRGKIGISPWVAADARIIPNRFKISFYLTTRAVFREHPNWDEVLRLNNGGDVVDGGYSTPMWLFKKTVYVPPLILGALESVTRSKVIALCKKLGIAVKEKTWKAREVFKNGELFFVGSGVGIMSPTHLNGRKINKEYSLAVRLWNEYRQWTFHKGSF